MATQKKKKKKKQNAYLPLILVILVTVGVAAAVLLAHSANANKSSTRRISADEYFGNPGSGKLAVVTDDTVAEEKAFSENGMVYIPYTVAKDDLGAHIYYDEGNRLLTVTTPTMIRNVVPGKGEGEQGAYCLYEGGRTDGGTEALYVSIEFLETFCDIRSTLFSQPDRIVLTAKHDTLLADVSEDTVLRLSSSDKTSIVRDLSAGQTLKILGEADGFYQAETGDGYLGYVKRSAMGTPYSQGKYTSPLGEYTSICYPDTIRLCFHQADSQAANAALAESLTGTHDINILAPTWIYLNDREGGVIDLTSAEYVNEAHRRGMDVFVVVNDFDGGLNSGADTLAVLSDTIVRQALAEKIVTSTLESGADGINLDLENVKQDAADAFLAFVRELSVLCRTNGLILSACSYVPQPYNLFLDRAAQAEVMDYVIIMAYDEHYAGSSEAGSVSSISWVRAACENGLAEIPAEKLVIALPFYTRLWETEAGGTPTSRAMSMREAENYVRENNLTVTWDEGTMQEYAVLSGNKKQEIWLENARSLRAKIELVKEYNVAGIAAWKLGLEKPEIWDVIEELMS